MKFIILREECLLRIQALLQCMEECYWKYAVQCINRLDLDKTIDTDELYSMKCKIASMQQELSVAFAHLRSLSLSVVESVVKWRKESNMCVTAKYITSIYWCHDNYIIKMNNDIPAMLKNSQIMNMWLGFTPQNTFLLPPPNHDPRIRRNERELLRLAWIEKSNSYATKQIAQLASLTSAAKSNNSSIVSLLQSRSMSSVQRVNSMSSTAGNRSSTSPKASHTPIRIATTIQGETFKNRESSHGSFSESKSISPKNALQGRQTSTNKDSATTIPIPEKKRADKFISKSSTSFSMPILEEKDEEEAMAMLAGKRINSSVFVKYEGVGVKGVISDISRDKRESDTGRDEGLDDAGATKDISDASYGHINRDSNGEDDDEGDGEREWGGGDGSDEEGSGDDKGKDGQESRSASGQGDDEKDDEDYSSMMSSNTSYSEKEEEWIDLQAKCRPSWDSPDDVDNVIPFWNTLDHNPRVLQAAVGFPEVFPTIYLVPPLPLNLIHSCEKAQQVIEEEIKSVMQLEELKQKGAQLKQDTLRAIDMETYLGKLIENIDMLFERNIELRERQQDYRRYKKSSEDALVVGEGDKQKVQSKIFNTSANSADALDQFLLTKTQVNNFSFFITTFNDVDREHDGESKDNISPRGYHQLQPIRTLEVSIQNNPLLLETIVSKVERKRRCTLRDETSVLMIDRGAVDPGEEKYVYKGKKKQKGEDAAAVLIQSQLRRILAVKRVSFLKECGVAWKATLAIQNACRKILAKKRLRELKRQYRYNAFLSRRWLLERKKASILILAFIRKCVFINRREKFGKKYCVEVLALKDPKRLKLMQNSAVIIERNFRRYIVQKCILREKRSRKRVKLRFEPKLSSTLYARYIGDKTDIFTNHALSISKPKLQDKHDNLSESDNNSLSKSQSVTIALIDSIRKGAKTYQGIQHVPREKLLHASLSSDRVFIREGNTPTLHQSSSHANILQKSLKTRQFYHSPEINHAKYAKSTTRGKEEDRLGHLYSNLTSKHDHHKRPNAIDNNVMLLLKDALQQSGTGGTVTYSPSRPNTGESS